MVEERIEIVNPDVARLENIRRIAYVEMPLGILPVLNVSSRREFNNHPFFCEFHGNKNTDFSKNVNVQMRFFQECERVLCIIFSCQARGIASKACTVYYSPGSVSWQKKNPRGRQSPGYDLQKPFIRQRSRLERLGSFGHPRALSC